VHQQAFCIQMVRGQLFQMPTSLPPNRLARLRGWAFAPRRIDSLSQGYHLSMLSQNLEAMGSNTLTFAKGLQGQIFNFMIP
jgi:hypothetical protein